MDLFRLLVCQAVFFYAFFEGDTTFLILFCYFFLHAAGIFVG